MIPQLTFHLTYIPTFYLTYIFHYIPTFYLIFWAFYLTFYLAYTLSLSGMPSGPCVPPPRASGRLLQLAIPRIVSAPWHKEEDGGTRKDRKEWRSCTGKSRDPHLAGGLKYVKIQVLMLGFPWFPMVSQWNMPKLQRSNRLNWSPGASWAGPSPSFSSILSEKSAALQHGQGETLRNRVTGMQRCAFPGERL